MSDLGQLISEDLLMRAETSEFSLSNKDATYRSSSVDGLLDQRLSQDVDRLSFTVRGWTEKGDNIDRSISIDLSRRTASCQIRSDDEVWFRGKIQQITDFFKGRRPWYGRIVDEYWISFLFGALETLLLLAAGMFAVIGKYLFAIIAGVTVFILNRGHAAFMKGRLFPLIDIQLLEKEPRLSREVMMVIFAGIMACGTVITVIMQIMEMGRP